MFSVKDNIRNLTKEQKITELLNYLAGQGLAVDIDDVLAMRDGFSDSALDITLQNIAEISTVQTALVKKITSITNCTLSHQSLPTEQLAAILRRSIDP